MENEPKQWVGKTIIGLTGNIGTGKSVVRHMLEHLGAFGIDADRVSHQMIARGAAGYLPVVEYFGSGILAPDGEIDRAGLGRIVFSSPAALRVLESIIHPLVIAAVDLLIGNTPKPVIVIEAIKLLESGTAQRCNSIWVVTADPETQLNRLMAHRSMPEADARQRIAAQPSQQLKLARANVVINNSGALEETWRQVKDGWLALFPNRQSQPELLDTAAVAAAIR